MSRLALLVCSLSALVWMAASSCEQALLKAQMDKLHPTPALGGEFYKTFFTIIPEGKSLFTGKFSAPGDVVGMAYYQNLGQLFLNMLKQWADVCNDEEKFKSVLKTLKIQHDAKKVTSADFRKAKPVVFKFLGDKLGMNPAEKKAWDQLLDEAFKLYDQV